MDKRAHEVLGIGEGASEREVRRAYRALLFDLEDNGQSDPEYLDKKERLESAFHECLEKAQSNQDPDESKSALENVQADPEAIRKKLGIRLAIGLFIVAAIILAYGYVNNWIQYGGGESHTDTAGMIAALETVGNTTKLVVFKADGTKIDVPGYTPGVTDRDPAWRPDGDRLLFVSTRGDGNFNVYRWNPKGGLPELRSQGGRSKANLYFGSTNDAATRDNALLTSGGFVLQYNQKTAQMTQLLPPSARKTEGGSAEEGTGSISQMESLYKQIGTGFIRAVWGKGRTSVWTIMATDNGQALVYQPLEFEQGPDGKQTLAKPFRLIDAEKIQFSLDSEGRLFAVTTGPTKMDLNRTVGYADKFSAEVTERTQKAHLDTLPDAERAVASSAIEDQVRLSLKKVEEAVSTAQIYVVGVPGPGGPVIQPLVGLSGAGRVFSEPAASPTDDRVALVLTQIDPKTNKPSKGIVIFSPSSAPMGVVEGDVGDPSWSPDGKRLLFTMRVPPDGNRAVYEADLVSQKLNRISQSGDFSAPVFSPQVPSSSR